MWTTNHVVDAGGQVVNTPARSGRLCNYRPGRHGINRGRNRSQNPGCRWNIRGTFWEHSGNVLGAFRKLSGKILPEKYQTHQEPRTQLAASSFLPLPGSGLADGSDDEALHAGPRVITLLLAEPRVHHEADAVDG